MSWPLGEPLDRVRFRDLGGEFVLDWTGVIDPDRFVPFQLAAIQVVSLPAKQNLPVLAVRRSVKVNDNQLLVAASLTDPGMATLMEVGGTLLIDVVCDFLRDDRGQPFSSSLSAALGFDPQPLAPGGLMRLAIPVTA